MRILIAGGAGYVGSALVPHLLQRGHQVTVVDLLWFGNHLPPETRVICKDVLNLTEGEVAGFDQVLFLAGLSNDPMADFAPNQNYVSNTAAPAYLAWLAKRVGVQRFVYSGSCAVYGLHDQGVRVETDAPECTTPYGISKYLGEQSALYLADRQFAVTSLRLGTVSGFSPRMRLDLVVNAMFRSAVETSKVVVFNPEIWRPILGIPDAAAAFTAALEADSDVQGIFNVASLNLTIEEIGRTIQGLMQELLQKEVVLELHHMKECRSYKVSTRKAQEVLGFRPTQTISDMVQNLWDNRHHFPDMSANQYYNIRFLQANDSGFGVQK